MLLNEKQALNLDNIYSILSKKYNISNIRYCHPASFNSFAYEVNEDLIIRFPKYKQSMLKLSTECQILKFLKDKISLKIPETFINLQPYFYTTHKKIPGTPLTQEKLLQLPKNKQEKFYADIALFIFELNSYTNEISSQIDIPVWDRIENSLKPSEVENLILKDNNFSKIDYHVIKNMYKNFSPNNEKEKLKFSHFDIISRNLAFDDKKQELNGIYDFGNCSLGLVKYDFCQIRLDFNYNTISEISRYYNKLCNSKLDIDEIEGYALHLMLSLYLKFRSNHCLYKIKEFIDSIKARNMNFNPTRERE